MKKVSEFLRLKETDPTFKKVIQLYEFADQLGLIISFGDYVTEIIDRDRNEKLPTLFIEETDSGNKISEWPPALEFGIFYKNPEFLAQQKQEREAWEKKCRQEEAARKAKEQAAVAEAQKLIEARERAELKRLQKKYGK